MTLVFGQSVLDILGSSSAMRMDFIFVFVGVVYCQVEISATSLSRILRSPTDCGESYVRSTNLKNEEIMARAT